MWKSPRAGLGWLFVALLLDLELCLTNMVWELFWSLKCLFLPFLSLLLGRVIAMKTLFTTLFFFFSLPLVPESLARGSFSSSASQRFVLLLF